MSAPMKAIEGPALVAVVCSACFRLWDALAPEGLINHDGLQCPSCGRMAGVVQEASVS